MKNIIVGNGINIQYGGDDYKNSNNIKRAIDTLKSGNFPSEILMKMPGG